MGNPLKAGHLGPICAAACLAAACFPSDPALARRDAGGETEIVVERLHSDLPLYTFDWPSLWPRSFTEGESFGCASRVAFGDWRFTPDKHNEREEEGWQRFGNYGVIHCAAVLQEADTRAELEAARWEYGFFVQLGNAKEGEREWELWALQKGMRPGSDYTLLARETKMPGAISEFRLLQQRCPSGKLREIRGLDVWGTRYCAINSRAELLALARRMLRYPFRGTIVRVADAA